MANKCTPGYWFLNENDLPRVVLRETGRATEIPKHMLLPRRRYGWSKNAVDDWNVPKAVDVLVAPYTSNNLVTPLVDGKAYMEDLYQKLQSVGAQDFVLLAGWEFTLTQSLKYDDKARSQLPTVLGEAIQRQAAVRLLAWDSLLPGVGNQKLADLLKGAVPVRNAYVDANLDGAFLSHHQKEVVIGKQHWIGSCAYVGGIDLAADRWDDAQHAKAEMENHFIGWHDIQVRVEGDAVMQLWANFAERWINNNAWLVKRKESYRLAPCPQPAWTATTPGTHHVQMLRTVTPARSGFQERDMRYGERTVLCALQKAIAKAECYIYIEEQFLWDCELADFIAQQMLQKRKLRLIVVIAASTELPLHYGQWHYHSRSKFFMRVMGKQRKEEIAFGPQTRVYAYGLFRTAGQAVYVHSKLVIIDDRYVAIGSANVDARSMFVDTELTLGVVDGDVVDSRLGGVDAKVCRFARNLREQLWMEHLGAPSSVELPNHDPIWALETFFPGGQGAWPANKAEAKNTAKHHIRCYVNVPGANWLTRAMERILDRNERHW